MLVIRKAQMEALDADTFRRFLLRMVRHVRAEFPAKVASHRDEQLLASLRDSVKRAQSFGIRGATDLQLFADLDYLLEPRFEFAGKYAWIRRLLQDVSLPPDSRLALIYQRLEVAASGSKV